jgi:hypothetical protein
VIELLDLSSAPGDRAVAAGGRAGVVEAEVEGRVAGVADDVGLGDAGSLVVGDIGQQRRVCDRRPADGRRGRIDGDGHGGLCYQAEQDAACEAGAQVEGGATGRGCHPRRIGRLRSELRR